MKVDLKNITLKLTDDEKDFAFWNKSTRDWVFPPETGVFAKLHQSYKYKENAYLYSVDYTLNPKFRLPLPDKYLTSCLKVGFSTQEDRNKRPKRSSELMLPDPETQKILLKADILTIVWIEQCLHLHFREQNSFILSRLPDYKFAGRTEVYPFIQEKIENYINKVGVPNWDYYNADEIYKRVEKQVEAQRTCRQFERWSKTEKGQEKLRRRKEVEKAMKTLHEKNKKYDCPYETYSEEARIKDMYEW